jgi:hypothetical protein
MSKPFAIAVVATTLIAPLAAQQPRPAPSAPQDEAR